MPADKDLPAAAKAAGAAADELHKKIYAAPEPAPEPQPEPAPAAPPEPAPAPAPEPAPTPAPPVVTVEGNEDDKTWKQKYQSVHGRFKHQEKTIRDQAERIANLEALFATMQAAPAPTPPPELQAASLLTPEEVEQFGPDFINVVGKKAKEIVTPEVAALRKQMADLEKKLNGVGSAVVHNAQQQMLDTLTAEVPNWRELNTDENFLAWLGLPDTLSGAIRQDLLSAAYDQNDTRRVLAFFKGFLAEQAATAPAPAAQPDPATTVPKVPLEALAAPGRAKTAAQIAPAEKPVITRAEISQFYVDKAAGRYRGRDEQAAAFEQQIQIAMREQRIR